MYLVYYTEIHNINTYPYVSLYTLWMAKIHQLLKLVYVIDTYYILGRIVFCHIYFQQGGL